MTGHVVVVGATGRTGRHLVAQARAAGLAVTAFARHPEALGDDAQGARLVAGDVRDPTACAAALHDGERAAAVLCALGPGRGSPPDLCSAGTRTLLAAMAAAGVRRLVAITGALIGHPHDRLGWFYRVMRRLQGERGLGDRRLQERLIQESDCDWTIVRPPRLLDVAPRGSWRQGPDLHIGWRAAIGRADLAAAMLRCLDDPSTIGTAVAVAY